ncbi:AEC family transporter [uncultured Shewanella sp.]|uniref:AEC family transporter n=1 Tax=uncultured Shewanella sp. TaxID=173975 RepID=UPI002620428A|nr:AEC family transporter [uncultured Shewanella sp.]
MPLILTPLMAIVFIMLLGAIIQKIKVLPNNADQSLNLYVYYVALPAIIIAALSNTPIDEILQWGFIISLTLAMLLSYGLCIIVSLIFNPKNHSLAAIRALNATFGNTAFIGIPIMMLLFPQQHNALTAAAVASLISILMFAITLVTIELQLNKQHGSGLTIIMRALGTNPIVIAGIIGITLSSLSFTLFAPLNLMLNQIGATSSPCALFAIGMALAKAPRQVGTANTEKIKVTELCAINFVKLLLQPVLAYCLLFALNVEHQLLIMGVILSALPTAASVYLLAQRYQIRTLSSALIVLLGTLLSFLSLPLIETLLTKG